MYYMKEVSESDDEPAQAWSTEFCNSCINSLKQRLTLLKLLDGALSKDIQLKVCVWVCVYVCVCVCVFVYVCVCILKFEFFFLTTRACAYLF